jgi:NADH-quinone oxidoreductase subunit N
VEYLANKLSSIEASFILLGPELMLSTGIVILVILGLFKKITRTTLTAMSALIFVLTIAVSFALSRWTHDESLFEGMLRRDSFSLYLGFLIDLSALLTVAMTWRRQQLQRALSEYYALLITIALGAHLLVMSVNLLMVFLSLEMVSLSSYVLAGFAFSHKGTEGSMKYFLFGSVSSAAMLYGFSLLYGLTGTLDFSSREFTQYLIAHPSPLFFVAAFLGLAGFLYKMAAAPLHPWAPDVYEAAPMPVIAFFAVVPKLAGLGVLTRFTLALHGYGQSSFDWQFVLSLVALLSLTVGNFSALWQKNAKRLMGYSSIAQSGFLLVGVAAFVPQGIHYMLFYASAYVVMNFLVFLYLQYFESLGFSTLESFAGSGKILVWPSVFLLVGLVALTGLPPTGGFTGKLFIFSSLWDAYQLSGKGVLLWLMVFGLLNTVVSLFYYLRIPFYAFVRSGEFNAKPNYLTFENLLGLILVLGVLYLFFNPGLLMGWINKINFVL